VYTTQELKEIALRAALSTAAATGPRDVVATAEEIVGAASQIYDWLAAEEVEEPDH